ncbi:hypothetical protein BX659_1561, partial [Orenia metallireducens]
RVEVLDIRFGRWTLEDGWINNILKTYSKENKGIRITIKKGIKLIEHPQIKVLLEGVEEGYRNSAQYALALACKYDELSLEEATELILEQNKRCSPSERENKVRSIIKSAYRSKKGLSSIRVAEIVSGITGKEVKPDYSLFVACKESIDIKQKNRNKGAYTAKEVTVRKVVKKALELIRKGVKVLPSIKEMAKLTGVSAGTLRSRGIWKTIIKILQSIGLQLNKEAHYHHKYIILDKAKEILKEGNSSMINLNNLEAILRAYKTKYSIVDILNQKTEKEVNSFIELITGEIMANSPP